MLALVSICKVFSSVFCNLCKINKKNKDSKKKKKKKKKNLLRSVIPDYFSERKPGDRLTKVQTLRLAKKYIAALKELLETC